VAANNLEQFAERNVDRDRHESRCGVGRDRVGRRGGFARTIDHMEVTVVLPEAEFGAVRRGGLVDGDVPVARVVTERKCLDRIAVVLSKIRNSRRPSEA